MPVEAKPLFRPDVLQSHLSGFQMPTVDAVKLAHWAGEISSGRLDRFGEQEILPPFFADVFVGLLGYTGPAGHDRYTIGYERHVEVDIDGKYADAVLGDFNGHQRYVVAVEGKGPRDPLDRPYAGRRMSAVDQGYRYAINLPCDWIIVTSIRQTRLYHKGSNQQTYERFDTEQLAGSEAALRRFLFLLGAERMVPDSGRSHLCDLLAESEKVGRELTKSFYVNYANMRQDAFEQLSRDNADVPRHGVLTSAQKLLDRVLFTAFCEDRGLLPTDTIKKAYEHRDPYHPRPIWENFRGLFNAINKGNAALGIHRYNGGLFADDPVLDSLVISNEVCGYFRDLGDVVVANPPYIRQEWISEFKPYLQANYKTYHGMAELYVYFYELGLRVLRPGGLMSFIVTNKWMKSGYGEPLRRFFGEHAWIESVVDFGHAKQIFADADVFPSIIVARKPTKAPKPKTARLCSIPREQLCIDDLSRQIETEGCSLSLDQLKPDGWQLEPQSVIPLLKKISDAGVSLREFTGKERYRGVTTGLNEAFLIDTVTKSKIIREDPRSAEIIKPYVRGQDGGRSMPRSG